MEQKKPVEPSDAPQPSKAQPALTRRDALKRIAAGMLSGGLIAAGAHSMTASAWADNDINRYASTARSFYRSYCEYCSYMSYAAYSCEYSSYASGGGSYCGVIPYSNTYCYSC